MSFFSLDHYGLGTNIIDLNKYDRYRETQKTKKDSKSNDSKEALTLVVDATRAGSIVNRRMYTASSMKKAADSFLKPFFKPILKDHRSDSVDFIIGRAKAVDFEVLAEGAKYDSDFLYAKKGSAGSARILVTADILDSDAIMKFLDGRFATFSTGQRLSNMLCSHCGKDFFSYSGSEDHFPGQMAALTEDSPLVKGGIAKDGAKMEVYGISNLEQYDELSTVVTPAQPRAVIERIINDFLVQNSLDAKDEKATKYAINLAKVLVGAHYSRNDSGLYTVHMTDCNHVSHSLMLDDYQAEIEQTVTGKTFVRVDMPVDSQNNDLPQSNDNEQTSQKNEAQGAKDKNKPNTEGNNMGDAANSNGNTVNYKEMYDLALEAKKRIQEKHDALVTAKATVDGQLKTANDELVAIKAKLGETEKELKDSYADSLLTIRRASSHATVKDLDEKALAAHATELKARTVDSLKNALSDERPVFLKILSDFKDSVNGNFADETVANPTAGTSEIKTDNKKTVKDELADL